MEQPKSPKQNPVLKIPDDNHGIQILQKSDLFGNIWYTKNIDLRNSGYIKLSSRVISIKNQKDDSSFSLPNSFGRTGTGQFYVGTQSKPYVAQIQTTSITVNEDAITNEPPLTIASRGKWWQNFWHETTVTDFRYRLNNSTWTIVANGDLTSGKLHPLEVHRGRNTMCVGNGNVVLQYDVNYVHNSITDLVLSTDYEVVDMSYSNDRIGIITQLSNTVSNQNRNAFFFVWDGATPAVNNGYDIGSDQIVAIAPYATSWAILTRNGYIKVFTGGGFINVGILPYWFRNILWSDPETLKSIGNCMIINGDYIYINLPTSLNVQGLRSESNISNYPGGVYCYDPTIGLYHMYAPTLSEGVFISVANSNITTSTNTLTSSTPGILPPTGSPIKYINDPTILIGGLVYNQVYYLINLDGTNFKLATSYANAVALIPVTITSTGQTTNNFLAINVLDYGVTLTTGVQGAISLMSEHKVIYDHMIFGGEIDDYNSGNAYGNMFMTVPGFYNRGYLVTSRRNSEYIEDTIQKVFLKFQPLNTGDSIVVKEQNSQLFGFPIMTNQRGVRCTWTSANSFTCATDLSLAYAYLQANPDKQLECEVIAGAGAGQSTAITNITLSLGIYTVTLLENIDGAQNGFYCDSIIDNWTWVKTITNELASTYDEVPVGKNSKWCKIKVELRGIDVTLEELQIISIPYRLAA
jgi:hypothetical protein